MNDTDVKTVAENYPGVRVDVTLVWSFGAFETLESLSIDEYVSLMLNGRQDGDDEVTAVILWPETSVDFRERHTGAR